ncbi:unnamed protein product [Rotaria magnacalcarata]|uniref:Helix-turn-helix domain-containing protein n=3 Tax=Rotaria magnacalcarata TaxID=392030 RepID=A0A820NR47_9BILA|nr:unnamed protein product [Rotaria magnacalcarata]CAF4390396.1 unnamed protein product [Rotaria magnacalcarata]
METNSNIEIAIEHYVQQYGIQIQIAQHLYEKRAEAEKAKRTLKELKYRIFYNRPLLSLDSIENSKTTANNTSTTTTTINSETSQQQSWLNTYEKQIERKKMNLMAMYIAKAESQFYQCQKIFDDELSRMWQNHRNLVKNQGMTTTLIHLIERRLALITEKFRQIYNYRFDYYLQNDQQQQQQRIGFSTSLIIDTTHHTLTKKEIQLLNRGPSYVPPYQLSISSSMTTNDEIIKRKYAPLKHQLATLFSKYHINIAVSMDIEQKINEQFKNLFSSSLPSTLRQRAQYEKHLVQSIHRSLLKNNLILRRTADNMNSFYLGNLQNFQTKAKQYLSNSDSFQLIMTLNETNQQESLHDKFHGMIESINFALKILKHRKAIDPHTITRLLLDPTKIQLSDMDFLCDISHENELQLVPLLPYLNTLTSKIGEYLNRLLRPFADRIMKTTRFHHDIDFIQKLNHYACTQRRLTTTTLFCTIKISNFYYLDSHANIIDWIGYFLQDNLGTNKLEQISIMTIKNLLQLFLYNNIFRYHEHIYTFTKGSPTTMPITDTLSNIYLFQWQTKLLRIIKQNDGFFGRCKDELFFTWNSSSNELHDLLQSIKIQYPNVYFHTSIGSNVNYLNLYITNQNGQLYTRVNRDATLKENYILPYVTGHPKLMYSIWFRSALIRAACCCSLVKDFQQERIYLELTLLVNGYSLRFVEHHVQHFFDYFHAYNMRYLMDQMIYETFRQHWFDFITMKNESQEMTQQIDDNGHLIRLNYLYEQGPRCQFNQEFYQLWSSCFKNHSRLSEEKSKVILTTKHVHSLNVLLAQSKLKHQEQV